MSKITDYIIEHNIDYSTDIDPLLTDPDYIKWAEQMDVEDIKFQDNEPESF